MSAKQMKEREGIELTGKPWEDEPLNPSLQSIYLQQLQAAEQQQIGGGAPGQPGDQPPGDPPPGEPGSDQGQDQQGGQPVATDSSQETAQRDRQQ